MAEPLPKIVVPPDFNPAPLDKQIEAVTRTILRVGDDEARGRIHPSVAALRRWELKSVLKTLQQQATQSQESHA